MKNIYKRSPYIRKLPSGYADLESLGYKVLSNIKGLQIYDNPLAAKQESTYNCKNVYTDELANLTVRPRLQFEKELIENTVSVYTWNNWVFRVSELVLNTPQRTFIAAYQNSNKASISMDGAPYNGDITFHEFNNSLYIMLDVHDDCLRLYKATANGIFEEVEGTINLADLRDPDEQSFNILNNKFKVPVSKELQPPYNIGEDFQILATLGIEIEDTFRMQWLDDIHLMVCYSDTVVILDNASNVIRIKLPGMNFKNHLDMTDWSILYDGKLIYLTIRGYENLPKYGRNGGPAIGGSGTPGRERPQWYSATVTGNVGIYYYCMDITGSLSTYDSAEFSNTNIKVAPLYGYGGIILLVNPTDKSIQLAEVDSGTYNTIGDKKEYLYDGFFDSDYISNLVIGYDREYVYLLNLSTNKLHHLEYTYEGFGSGAMETLTHYPSSNSELDIDTSTIMIIPGPDISFMVQTVKDVGNYATSGVTQYRRYSGNLGRVLFYHGYPSAQSPSSYRQKTYAHPIQNDVPTSNLFTLQARGAAVTSAAVFYENCIIFYQAAEVVKYKPPMSPTSTTKLQYNSLNIVRHPSETEEVFTEDTAYVSADATLRLFIRYESKVLYLDAVAPAPEYQEIIRDTSQIPVLSDIHEPVITSFFLDNIYWFITQHHVFGSGVAEGQFTIEYFDPLKYFEISESITGAIRVSDTSFWVFHSNGAYLIYKTSYDESVGVPRWLITETAKSKGCDFINGLATSPSTAQIISVTNDDISVVTMRQNVQTDERILIPLSLPIRSLARDLLAETKAVKIAIWRYLMLFILNVPTKTDTPVLVYDSASDNWWYWTFPCDFVTQVEGKDDSLRLTMITGDTSCVYSLSSDLWDYKIGNLTYEVYTDKLNNGNTVTPIEWYWESALLTFDSINFRKQLLLTTFTFGDSNVVDDNGVMFNTEMNFEYFFEVYSKIHSEKVTQSAQQFIQRASNNICKTVVSGFTYIQLYLRSMQYDDALDFESLTKPQISCISFKYRLLPGDIV